MYKVGNMQSSRFRTEKDSLGDVMVPEEAYYGAQTQRAVENFPISGQRFPRPFIKAIGLIKGYSSETNAELGQLDPVLSVAISKAAKEVAEGLLDGEFVVDVYQTGSGTSTNMNANEVIASRANEFLGGKRGDKSPVHPNDHVNKGQSSNDVIPTVIHVAAYMELEENLLPGIERLERALKKKAESFYEVLKIGRTHLQDAVPMRLSQEFGAYATMVRHAGIRIKHSEYFLSELPIGGTAVGTGLNAHPKFGQSLIKKLCERLRYPFRAAEDRFEAMGAKDALVELSGSLKSLAVSLMKIANDVRLLNSGPRCGIGEIQVPSVQPGSSIMPGKVNPVTAEMVCQVAARAIGNDAIVTMAGFSGNLELNTMMPIIAHAILESLSLLTNAMEAFRTKCIEGILSNSERCHYWLEKSLALVTALTPKIGYDKAAGLAKQAYETGKPLKDVLLEEGICSREEAEVLLNPSSMLGEALP